MKKYYTPNIEDIHVGYECEIESSWGWQKGKWPSILQADTLTGFDAKENGEICATERGWLRTPYLTEEQILEEGWKLSHHRDANRVGFEKDNYFLIYHLEEHRINLSVKDPSIEIKSPGERGYQSEHFRFQCTCPSINEFRKICKMLEI